MEGLSYVPPNSGDPNFLKIKYKYFNAVFIASHNMILIFPSPLPHPWSHFSNLKLLATSLLFHNISYSIVCLEWPPLLENSHLFFKSYLKCYLFCETAWSHCLYSYTFICYCAGIIVITSLYLPAEMPSKSKGRVYLFRFTKVSGTKLLTCGIKIRVLSFS